MVQPTLVMLPLVVVQLLYRTRTPALGDKNPAKPPELPSRNFTLASFIHCFLVCLLMMGAAGSSSEKGHDFLKNQMNSM
jgi:hypothetical protein